MTGLRGGPWSAKKLGGTRKVPHGVTLIGRLFGEDALVRVGMAMEGAFGVSGAVPGGFA